MISTDYHPATESQSILSDFEHEEADYCDSKLKLYGRHQEDFRLKAAFDHLNLTGSKKMMKVIIHGESGSGKTALVDTLRLHTCTHGGFFVAGKYFQNTEIQEPYSAIMAAFSDLCDLIVQSVDFTEERRIEIQQKLGWENGRILRTAISNLSPFLESSCWEEFADYCSASMYPKFMVACKSFLKAFSSKNQVIVMFLDDIQWADEGSKHIISLLLNDQEINDIMLILSYRDEESSSISDITRNSHTYDQIIEIALNCLEFSDVYDLSVDMFAFSNEKALNFSKILMAKTFGNPFHVTQFIEFVKGEGLLVFCEDSQSWDFDADDLQHGVMLSDKLADLLTKKIAKLPTELQESLKIASLIGFFFHEDLVFSVHSRIGDEMIELVDSIEYEPKYESLIKNLEIGIQEGFIVKLRQGYQFSHDKLQSAFHNIINKKEKDHLHHLIGKYFASLMEPESNYFAVIHLQQAPGFLQEESNCLKLASLSLSAAGYCKSICAFTAASTILHKALDYIENNEKWTVHHDLSFRITLALAKLEIIIGKHTTCSELMKTALLHSLSKEMIVDCLMIDIECSMAQNNIDETIAAATLALRHLGTKLPRRISMLHVIAKLLKIKMIMNGKSDSDILSLPRMSESSVSTSVKVLVNMCTFCFLKDEEFLAVYAALLAVELTLKHGLNDNTATALTIYGVAELSLGNRKRAYRFGKLAILVQERLQNISSYCLTTAIAHSTLTHWYDPLWGLPNCLQNAATVSFEIGDIGNGAFSLAMSYGMHLILGTNLHDLRKTMWDNNKIIRDLSQDALAMWTHAFMQVVLNLTSYEVSEWKELILLNGEIIDEISYFSHAQEAKNMLLISNGWYAKGMLAVWFGYWSIATELFQRIMCKDNSFHFGFGGIQVKFFAGLSSYSQYSIDFERKCLKLARRYRAYLEKFRSQNYPFVDAYLSLLNAEDLAAKKSSSPQAVREAYLTSIDAFANKGLHHFEALANERAGTYQLRIRKLENAKVFLQRASHLYKNEWKSSAKYHWLQDKFNVLLEDWVQPETNLVGQCLTITDFVPEI